MRVPHASSCVVVLAVGLFLAVAAPSEAQEGVFVDPDSAPGKEYALPLDSARSQAAPVPGASGAPADAEQAPASGASGPAPAPTPAPAFGIGVERAGDDSSSGQRAAASDGEGTATDSRGTSQRPPEEERAATVPSAGVGATVWGGLTAALVLLIAAGIAWTARQQRRARP